MCISYAQDYLRSKLKYVSSKRSCRHSAVEIGRRDGWRNLDILTMDKVMPLSTYVNDIRKKIVRKFKNYIFNEQGARLLTRINFYPSVDKETCAQ